jgi:hypothetical protein
MLRKRESARASGYLDMLGPREYRSSVLGVLTLADGFFLRELSDLARR